MNNRNSIKKHFNAEIIIQNLSPKSTFESMKEYSEEIKGPVIIPQASVCSPCMDVTREICANLAGFGEYCRHVPSAGKYRICAGTKHCGPFQIPCGVEVDIRSC
jgi:hypothetical protein